MGHPIEASLDVEGNAGGDKSWMWQRSIDGLLTPPSTLMALRAGYRPALHPSITAL